MPVRVKCGAVVARVYTYVPPHCWTSQYRTTFIPLSVSLWINRAGPVFDGVGLAGLKSRANAFIFMHTNDPPRVSNLHTPILFTDNTMLSASHVSHHELVDQVNAEWVRVADWTYANRLSINVDKMK